MAQPKKLTTFADRLRKYGLTPDDAHSGTLRVSKEGKVCLGGRCNRLSFHAPRLLQCKDIDDAKAWLGVPNSIFEKEPKLAERRECRRFPPSSIISQVDEGLKSVSGQKNLNAKKKLADELRNELSKHSADLSKLAFQYIFGDARPIQKWKRVLELQMHDWILPLWVYHVIVVEPGGVLEFDQGVNVLCADEVIIHPGGTIRSYGALTIDIARLKRPS